MRWLLPLLFLLFWVSHVSAQQGPAFVLKDRQRVVFLGDSNTFRGTFIAYMDAYLMTRFPDQRFELLNLGLPSETVSGLSEPDHPYPRPNVHDRLTAVLQKTKPNVVIACYGMNDGIYYPFREDRFLKYQEGINKLITAVEKTGAKVILMTPAPFDSKPIKDKVLPEKSDKFSWMQPYEKYDQEVLTRYSEWLLTLREKNYLVADPHKAILAHLEQRRRTNPDYRVSGDGIHPDGHGHAIIFRELMTTLDAPAIADIADFGLVKQPDNIINFKRDKDGVITFTWISKIPMPADPSWAKDLAESERLQGTLNYYGLRGQFLPATSYTVTLGDLKIDKLSQEELTSGWNLWKYPSLPTIKRSEEIWKLVAQRQELLGRAWLTDVGHKRPDTPKGIPLAEAQSQAKELEDKIRSLTKPIEISVTIRPIP